MHIFKFQTPTLEKKVIRISSQKTSSNRSNPNTHQKIPSKPLKKAQKI